MVTSLVSTSSCGIPIPALSYKSCLNSFILCEAEAMSNKTTWGLPSTSQRPQCTRYPFWRALKLEKNLVKVCVALNKSKIMDAIFRRVMMRHEWRLLWVTWSFTIICGNFTRYVPDKSRNALSFVTIISDVWLVGYLLFHCNFSLQPSNLQYISRNAMSPF